MTIAESTDTNDIKTLPFKLITPSGLNPRRHFDDTSISELAASIKARGLLQNLVVRSHADEEGVYEVVAGERRYRALRLLVDTGEIPKDISVPVKVEEVSDHELLLTATTENVQRQSMTPLEEADAFAQLMKLGDDEASIALRTGVAPSTVKLRLKLSSGLCADARRALEADKLTLAQTQALLLASKGLQKELLPRILEVGYSPKDIRRLITQDKIPVGRNTFPLERYTKAKGSIATDIFQPEHPGWFDDKELFVKLQNEAIEERMIAYREKDWVVEVTHHLLSWDYIEGEGVVVILNDYDFSVEFREGLVKRPEPEPSTPTGGKVQEKPKENRRRNEWEATTVTRALHEEAAKDFRLCLILNTMALLGICGFTLKIEESKMSRREPNNQIFSDVLQEAFDRDRTRLIEGFTGEAYKLRMDEESSTTPPYTPMLSAQGEGVHHVFHMLKALSDGELHALFARLTAVTIAHGSDSTPWSTDIKCLVARETGLDVADRFDSSDEAYLNLHTKAELAELAQAAGVKLDVSQLKKRGAVLYLSDSDKVKGFVPERLQPEDT